LTESPVMLAFFAQAFPQARRASLDDPFAFAQVQAFNLHLCSTLHVIAEELHA
jgi:glutathione S-transferase